MKTYKPDVVELVIKMQQQLNSLEKKIDAIAGRPQERSFEARQHSKPFQHFDRPHGQREARQDRDYRERTLYKAICADCNKECEVPFRPSQDRPVYCKECFASRKVGGPLTAHYDSKPAGKEIRQGGNKRYAGKKKTFTKKRKK
ncbi:MAG: hypothetical protein NTV07_04965 [Candidatus Omnitrophica bacterium]|nr:hypothetical protein [Candidatus Omnitrophota bacterium]